MYIQTVFNGDSTEYPVRSNRVISDNHMASLIAQIYFLKDSGEDLTFRHKRDPIGNALCDCYELLRGGKFTTFVHVSEDDRYTSIDLLQNVGEVTTM